MLATLPTSRTKTLAIRRSSKVITPLAGGQEKFLRDWSHRYVALEGGWGSGKTFAGAVKLLATHVHNARDANLRPTGVPSAIVAPTYGQASDYCVPAIYETAGKMNLRVMFKSSGTVANGRYAGPVFIFPDLGTRKAPSIILVRSAEHPHRITGWEVGAYWGDEPARWKASYDEPLNDPLLQLTGRLRHPLAKIERGYYTYTNEGDHTRIYELFHQKVSDDHSIHRATTRDNIHVLRFLQDQESHLTPELRLQYIEGEAISIRGNKCYSVFNRDVNVSDKVELSNDFPIDLSVDFNISPGMHIVIGQHNAYLDELIVTDVIHGPRMDVRMAVVELGRWLLEHRGIRTLRVFGDATGKSEWAGTSESMYDVLSEALRTLGVPFSMHVPSSNPAQTDRVNTFNVALKDLQGRVHWKCHSRCANLIEDLQKVKFDNKGKIDKTNPRITHSSDAEGYRVHYLRKIQRPVSTMNKFSV